MTIEEQIRSAVRAEMRTLVERIDRLIAGSGVADDLATVTKAAKACGLHPDTVRAKYLPALRRYGAGRLLRISVAELRAAMAEERDAAVVDADAVAASILERKKKGTKRGH